MTLPRYLVLRHPRSPVSARFATASVVVLLATLLAIVVVFIVAVSTGSFAIDAAELARSLVGQGTADSRFVVWDLRLPRLLCALLIGSGLAISGLIFQTVTRNPLAAPDILGIDSGAAIGAVGVIVLGGASATVPAAALTGGLLTAAALYLLSWQGGIGRYRLVLVGIALAALIEAGIGWLLTTGDLWEVQRAVHWMLGSLYLTSWSDVALLGVVIGGLAVIVAALARGMSGLQMGDDLATAMGIATERTRLGLLVAAVGMAAICVSVAGPIGFVAFMAPHMARRLARSSGAGVIPATAAIGALMLLLADTLARLLSSGGVELPVGIVTIAIGAPWFLWLLMRADERALAA
jgi:iron complex transport system permease protein